MSDAPLAPQAQVAPRRGGLVVGVVLVVAALAIGGATLLRGGSAKGESVRVAAVEKRGITQKVLAQGKVKARTQVEVASEIGGRVSSVAVKVGDVVKAGDLLFAVDDEQLKNAVEQLRVAQQAADAMLKHANLALDESARGLERDQKLREKGVVADEQLKLDQSRIELARADQESAKASLDRAGLDLQRARDALRRAKVTAPNAGTVVEVGVEVGQVVSAVQGLADTSGGGLLGSAGPSAPVVIADLAELIVKLDVDELDVGQVRVGQKAVVHAQGIKDFAFDGVVERVGLMGRDQAGAVLFAVEVGVQDTVRDAKSKGAVVDGVALPAPRELLRSGMSAQAEIEVQHVDDALALPVAAVLEGDGIDKPDRVFVFTGDDNAGTVKQASVKLGPTEGDKVAITSGVALGDKIVEGPFRALKSLSDGDHVVVDKKKDDDKDKDKKK